MLSQRTKRKRQKSSSRVLHPEKFAHKQLLRASSRVWVFVTNSFHTYAKKTGRDARWWKLGIRGIIFTFKLSSSQAGFGTHDGPAAELKQELHLHSSTNLIQKPHLPLPAL
jgi:hypothetical protein